MSTTLLTGPPSQAATRRLRRTSGIWPTSPALVLVLVFFVAPVFGLLLRSVLDPQPGLQNYAEVFASTTYLRVFVNIFVVATVVTIVTFLLAFPVAWFLAVAPNRWASLLFATIILSMWTNLLTRTYAWMVLLQRTGIINKTLMNWGLISSPLPLITTWSVSPSA
jgi:putative spermidine/putrescine transport system permease protein